MLPRRLLVLTAVIATLASCDYENRQAVADYNARNTIVASPNDDNVRYTGRWNFDDPFAPWVGWQGSTVSLRFRGSEIAATVEFDDSERLRVIVNGVPEEPARVVAAGKQTIVLAQGLDAQSEHTATLMKEEYATSVLTFHGFEITNGEVLAPPPRPDKRIAFFGDSNMEGFSLYDEKNGTVNDANGTYFAYPATVSRMLGTEMQLQAFGSATLDGPTANDVMSFIYSPALDREDATYRDPFRPHVIVVNAGANDISRLPPEDQKARIKARYRAVIASLREVYGDEPHIVLYNAYSWGLGEPAMYSHEVVDELGGNLSVLLFPWCWEQWHGDMVDHAGQARHLARHIESLGLGFSIRQDAEVVSGYGIGQDVANGGFERAARDGYGGFGWRYFEDGVERVRDPLGAKDGEHFIRLGPGEIVHQCVDSTGDFKPGPAERGQQYTLTAAIRSSEESGAAILGADYEGQDLYKRRNPELQSFDVSGEWQDYAITLTAPADAWKVYVILKSESGTIEYDHVRLTSP